MTQPQDPDALPAIDLPALLRELKPELTRVRQYGPTKNGPWSLTSAECIGTFPGDFTPGEWNEPVDNAGAPNPDAQWFRECAIEYAPFPPSPETLVALLDALKPETREEVLAKWMPGPGGATDCEVCGAKDAPHRWPFRGDCEDARLCDVCKRNLPGPLLEDIVRRYRWRCFMFKTAERQLNEYIDKTVEAERRATLAENQRDDAWRTIPPHEMVIYCPSCSRQHLDIGEFATRVHRKHKCENTPAGPNTGCGYLWVPFPYATKGVELRPATSALASVARRVPVCALAEDASSYVCLGCGAPGADDCKPGCWVSDLEAALLDDSAADDVRRALTLAEQQRDAALARVKELEERVCDYENLPREAIVSLYSQLESERAARVKAEREAWTAGVMAAAAWAGYGSADLRRFEATHPNPYGSTPAPVARDEHPSDGVIRHVLHERRVNVAEVSALTRQAFHAGMAYQREPEPAPVARAPEWRERPDAAAWWFRLRRTTVEPREFVQHAEHGLVELGSGFATAQPGDQWWGPIHVPTGEGEKK